MSFEPYKIDRQGFQVINDTNTETMSFTMEGTDRGLNLEYDIGSGNTKRFSIKPSGINFVDNTNNHTTGLERLALVQTAFQSVELPPNATTLKINDAILVDAGIATQSTTINDGTAIFSNASTGGALNPQLTLKNTNADNTSVALEIYKDKGVAPTNGDVLFNQSVYGKDSGNTKQEYTRITHTIRDITAGAEDASIEMGCMVNGAFANFLQINGNQNEVNCLKTLDMDGHNIRTSTGDMTITTTSSSGSGNITIAGKSAGITNINATTIGINASSILTMSATGAGAYMTATIDDDITLTSTNGDINLNANVSLGVCKVNATSLQFNDVNILPRHTFNALPFSVMGSPTTNILNFGALNDMIAGTRWKVDVAFYTGAINTRNVLTYVVKDTSNVDSQVNNVFGYIGGLQTAIQYDPTGTPMGTYCSFTDTFGIDPLATGGCSFILTGGTSDSSVWSGDCRVSIVLTRLS
jgi:hypothetical protein